MDDPLGMRVRTVSPADVTTSVRETPRRTYFPDGRVTTAGNQHYIKLAADVVGKHLSG